MSTLISVCYACGTVGPVFPVEVEGGHKLICEGECTWGEKEEVVRILTEVEFEGMMKVEAGSQEFSDWLNTKDPVKEIWLSQAAYYNPEGI